jgi:hypothetical protein
MAITNSTISGNIAQGAGSTNYSAGNGGRGGGLFAGENYDSFYGGSIQISNSTITGNTAGSVTADAPSYGGGVYNSSAQYYNELTLKGSLISGNSASSGSQIANYNATGVTSNNFNLFGSDSASGILGFLPGVTDVSGPPVAVSAILGPLAANGGLTKTHALIKASPALAKVISGCPATDQRGTKRPVPKKTACDIGSFEQK